MRQILAAFCIVAAMVASMTSQGAHADVRDIETEAKEAVVLAQERFSIRLDFSQASLGEVEKILATASQGNFDDTLKKRMEVVFDTYILEVGKRQFGGVYQQFRGNLILVVGLPQFSIALMPRDKVKGRLGGDEGDNIPFFYSGFEEAVRKAKPGDKKMYV
jgi:hypothetical protein